MQLIASSSSPARSGRLSFVGGVTVGAILLVAGLAFSYLVFGTSFLAALTPVGRPEPAQAVVGVVAWVLALAAPATFLVVGLARIVTAIDAVLADRPRSTPASRLVASLGEDYAVASRVQLPDGRFIQEIVIGPFGAAVIEQLPPPVASRRHGQSWEVRAARGRWTPIENPLERAARDAERVRRWFAHDDRDFVVKVYAAVISTDPTVERTSACAVITAEQIPAWLNSLPAQRSLTPSRRARLVEHLREGL